MCVESLALCTRAVSAVCTLLFGGCRLETGLSEMTLSVAGTLLTGSWLVSGWCVVTARVTVDTLLES